MADQPSLLDQLVAGARDADAADAADRLSARTVERAAAERDRSKGGRPAGRPNRRTRDLERLVMAEAGHPVLAMARQYAMPVEALARRLGCSRLDAAKLQIAAAREVAPYVAQKQPQAVQVDSSGFVPLVLADGHLAAQVARAIDDGRPADLDAVIEASFMPVDADPSDDGRSAAPETAETLGSQPVDADPSDDGGSDDAR